MTDHVPAALPRSALVLLTAAAAVLVTAGIHAARGILGPAFLALVLVVVTHPLRANLRRWLPNWAVSVISVLVVLLLVTGFAVAIMAAVARLGSLLGAYDDDFDALVADAVDRLRDVGVGPDELRAVASSFDLGRLADVLTSLLSGLAGTASSLGFILALCLFMTMDSREFSAQLAHTGTSRPDLVRALGEFARSTRHYLAVSTVFGFVVAVLDALALQVMGVPAPWLWGLLAFLTNYIPNIGFLIGLVPPAVLGLLEGGPGLLLAVIGVYCALNLVLQSGVQNKVVGDAVGLAPTLTFVSLVFWAWIIGPVGAVLAVPLSLLVRALLVDADPRAAWLSALIANRAPEAQPRAGPSAPSGA